MALTPETLYAKGDDGLHIAYQSVGDGLRDIVVVGGFAIDIAWDDPAFASVMRRLGRLGRLILVDMRGYGSSDPVPLGALPTPENWLDDLRVVMDAVGSERAHLIGVSGTGVMSILFAATYPERVASLSVIDAFARMLRSDDYPIGVPQRLVDAYLAWVEKMWGTPEFEALQTPSRATDASYLRWSARARRLTAGPAAQVAGMRWLSLLDIRAVLPAVQAPTLVMSTVDNPVVHHDHGTYLADRIPGARFVERHGTDDFFSSFTDSSEVLDAIEEFITGERQVAEPDRAFATILFTDVVGSTQKVAELGDDRWKQVLDSHDDLVARELDRHRGVKVNSTGDGVLATFDGPARAVRCAQAIVEAVKPLGIELRAGLHAGEVELRGGDIGGIAVHIGQRVSALAGAGEVLVSRTVTDLVAGSGLRFDDRGEHELKGVPGTWKVYAVHGT